MKMGFIRKSKVFLRSQTGRRCIQAWAGFKVISTLALVASIALAAQPEEYYQVDGDSEEAKGRKSQLMTWHVGIAQSGRATSDALDRVTGVCQDNEDCYKAFLGFITDGNEERLRKTLSKIKPNLGVTPYDPAAKRRKSRLARYNQKPPEGRTASADQAINGLVRGVGYELKSGSKSFKREVARIVKKQAAGGKLTRDEQKALQQDKRNTSQVRIGNRAGGYSCRRGRCDAALFFEYSWGKIPPPLRENLLGLCGGKSLYHFANCVGRGPDRSVGDNDGLFGFGVQLTEYAAGLMATPDFMYQEEEGAVGAVQGEILNMCEKDFGYARDTEKFRYCYSRAFLDLATDLQVAYKDMMQFTHRMYLRSALRTKCKVTSKIYAKADYAVDHSARGALRLMNDKTVAHCEVKDRDDPAHLTHVADSVHHTILRDSCADIVDTYGKDIFGKIDLYEEKKGFHSVLRECRRFYACGKANGSKVAKKINIDASKIYGFDERKSCVQSKRYGRFQYTGSRNPNLNSWAKKYIHPSDLSEEGDSSKLAKGSKKRKNRRSGQGGKGKSLSTVASGKDHAGGGTSDSAEALIKATGAGDDGYGLGGSGDGEFETNEAANGLGTGSGNLQGATSVATNGRGKTASNRSGRSKRDGVKYGVKGGKGRKREITQAEQKNFLKRLRGNMEKRKKNRQAKRSARRQKRAAGKHYKGFARAVGAFAESKDRVGTRSSSFSSKKSPQSGRGRYRGRRRAEENKALRAMVNSCNHEVRETYRPDIVSACVKDTGSEYFDRELSAVLGAKDAEAFFEAMRMKAIGGLMMSYRKMLGKDFRFSPRDKEAIKCSRFRKGMRSVRKEFGKRLNERIDREQEPASFKHGYLWSVDYVDQVISGAHMIRDLIDARARLPRKCLAYGKEPGGGGMICTKYTDNSEEEKRITDEINAVIATYPVLNEGRDHTDSDQGWRGWNLQGQWKPEKKTSEMNAFERYQLKKEWNKRTTLLDKILAVDLQPDGKQSETKKWLAENMRKHFERDFSQAIIGYCDPGVYGWRALADAEGEFDWLADITLEDFGDGDPEKQNDVQKQMRRIYACAKKQKQKEDTSQKVLNVAGVAACVMSGFSFEALGAAKASARYSGILGKAAVNESAKAAMATVAGEAGGSAVGALVGTICGLPMAYDQVKSYGKAYMNNKRATRECTAFAGDSRAYQGCLARMKKAREKLSSEGWALAAEVATFGAFDVAMGARYFSKIGKLRRIIRDPKLAADLAGDMARVRRAVEAARVSGSKADINAAERLWGSLVKDLDKKYAQELGQLDDLEEVEQALLRGDSDNDFWRARRDKTKGAYLDAKAKKSILEDLVQETGTRFKQSEIEALMRLDDAAFKEFLEAKRAMGDLRGVHRARGNAQAVGILEKGETALMDRVCSICGPC